MSVVTAQGLTSAEAAERLAERGPNRLPGPRRPSAVRRLLGELTHFFAVMLWVAGLLALGHPKKVITKLRRRPVEAFTTVDRFDGAAFS